MKKIIGLLFFAVCLAVTQPALATPLVVDGAWDYFDFAGDGSAWAEQYEFTLTTSAELIVTDSFRTGDLFSVFANGALLGQTSMHALVGEAINYVHTSDTDFAASDSRWSTGFWILGPGSYVITGTADVSPHGSGAGAIRLASTVPEPTTMVLFGSGLVGFFMRRRMA